TTVQFSVAQRSSPAQKTLLGTVPISALSRWQTLTQTVSFPVPSGLPVGTIGMQLTSNINPSRGNGEVKTGNNITTSNFDVVVAAATAPKPDLTVTGLSAPSSAAAGAALNISDTIRNMGSASAGGFSIGYYLDGPGGRTTLATHTSTGLAAN